MNQPRWLVEITGDKFHLEDLPAYFPDGDMYVVLEGERYYIVGSALEVTADHAEVRALALARLEIFAAAMKLIFGHYKTPALAGTYREHPDGRRDAFASGVVAELTIVSKIRANLDGVAGPTQAQMLATASMKNRALTTAMILWADEARTWPRLYRILDEVEEGLGNTVSNLDLCSDNQRERFMRSANSPSVAGLDARHSAGNKIPPAKPMTLVEATKFMQGVMLKALSSASSRGADG
ncbi:hypothetical protein [Roseateles sp.]|uniref:hypothetical protein n=1 Tax=Roseateles sp. TaxID=1971397 RepID=UPI003D0C29E8